jgi:hypothetical protein
VSAPSELPLFEEVEEISISPIPVGDINRPGWAVTVTFGGREVDGVKLYGVKNLGRALSRDGTWDHEPIPSSRTDEWLAEHRFPLEEAMTLARSVAHTITWNSLSADDVAERS